MHRKPIAACLAAALLLPACRRPGAAAEQLATAPAVDLAIGEAKCGVRKSAAKPLIVEWPATERAALEARVVRGLVAVRYEGCDMEIITTCTGKGAYEYVGLTQKREGVRINNADELYAQLPVGAAALEAQLERAGQLNVDMAIVGRREAGQSRFSSGDLEGRCDAATHVVTGLTVGAFSLYTGAAAKVGGAIKIGGAGVGAGSSARREVLKTDGDQGACSLAARDDTQPPDGCAALLRVEVVPIDRPASFTAVETPHDPTLDRKIARAKKMSRAGYAGLFGISATIAGVVVYVANRAELKKESGSSTVSSERAKSVAGARAGIGLMAAGGLLVAVGLSLGIIGSRRAKRLGAQRDRRAAVQPVVGPGGFGLAGRFAP